MCRPDDYPPHADPMHDYGMPCACPDCTGTDADRYAEALAGARAMRERARPWADYTDTPAIRPGADATERAYGIPDWDAPSCGACTATVRHSPLPGPCPLCRAPLTIDGMIDE